MPGTPVDQLRKGDLFAELALPSSTGRQSKADHTLPTPINKDESSRLSESVFARRERKKREKAARYAAFAALAQMAVESPQGNPFVGADGQGGAVRLGEYKRGFSGREIIRWARNVHKAQ